MSKIVNEYGALTTKVRAMYGRRLRYADFIHMASLHDVPAVLDYLRQTSWAPAMAKLELLPLSRANLEAVLREQTREEYIRLSSFAPRSDKTMMTYPVWLAEMEGIMICLRRLKAGRILEVRPLPDRFLIHSKMDYKLLMTCTDYDGLLTAVENSIYATALRHLRPEETGALPDYQVTESLLHTVYYSRVFREISKHYSGETKEILSRSLGVQIDLLNIIHILRLKQYFPDEKNTLPYLFPFHYRMRPAQLNELAAAPDMDTAFSLLENTAYAGAFEDVRVTEVEDFYRKAIYQFHRRQVMTGSPSICTAIAYLHLKEAEVTALINVIESVNYGVPFDDSFVKLIGD